ncbi:hypothetical protein FRB90_010706, partial [Tulasnella sp. 427]
SDAYDMVSPYIVHLSWSTSTTAPLFAFTLLSLFALIPVLYFVPLRLLFLILGLAPFVLTHPYTLSVLPSLINLAAPHVKAVVQKAVNDDRLREEHWRSRLATVSVWENQRWTATAGWSASNLNSEDRKAWTVGEESWAVANRGDVGTGQSNVNQGGSSSGRKTGPSTFVQTGIKLYLIRVQYLRILRVFGMRMLMNLCLKDGWVYMDSEWKSPRSTPLDEWKIAGMTRGRKWARRIYRP